MAPGTRSTATGDLLAFERSQPGPVMTGYNKINGNYAGGHANLPGDGGGS